MCICGLRSGHDGIGIPRSESIGIVHEVGEGVTRVKQGQRVVPITHLKALKGEGSWQEYICMEQELVYPVPDFMSDEIAAQFVINPWTANGMIDALAVPAGEYIVQSAALSVLGKQVIQICKYQGIKTINIVRRPQQEAELKALRADEVICSSEEVDLVARVKEVTGGKDPWGALDAVAGTMTQTLASTVRNYGFVVVYGFFGGRASIVNVGDLVESGVTVRGWSISKQILPDRAASDEAAAKVFEFLRVGVIKTAEAEKYDLAEFKVAMAKAEEPGRSKKVMLTS